MRIWYFSLCSAKHLFTERSPLYSLCDLRTRKLLRAKTEKILGARHWTGISLRWRITSSTVKASSIISRYAFPSIVNSILIHVCIQHVVFSDAQLLPFATNHRIISFTLYTFGFMGFVMSLKRGYLKQQFGLFCWVHMSLLLIVVSR